MVMNDGGGNDDDFDDIHVPNSTISIEVFNLCYKLCLVHLVNSENLAQISSLVGKV